MSGKGEKNEELKMVLQRQASGRDTDTTFEETPKKAPAPQQTMKEILEKAGKRALGGGIPGAAAMAVQVGSMMWLRTTMNYQYRYGTTTGQALKKLYAEGGIRRFYRGVGPALFQGPLSRFGDTAANAGVLALLEQNESTKQLPVAAKTFCASFTAGCWRMFLMPIDAMKTTLQVEGTNGLNVLKGKVAKGGPGALYHGAFGAAGATMVGHYPWFFTYNLLDEKLPKPDPNVPIQKFARSALMGFCSSFVSDCTSNSIRVIKTVKQTSLEPLSYKQAAQQVIQTDGLQGLFIRGLQTRILANGLQGMLFSVLWKFFQDQWAK